MFLAAAGLLVGTLPVSADHLQTDASKGIQFDHRGSNEWWVQVMLGGRDAGTVSKVESMDDGGPWTALAHQSWGGWAASFHIEPGHRVLFRATWPDGQLRTSCWFEHPSGIERCDAPPTTGFDASFSSVRGNEWWIQANVVANGPVSTVDVRQGTGAWQPLTKQSWGGWAASYRIVDGTIVQLRATSSDGQSDLSSCRKWIPPSGQDAQVVSCPGSPTFDATFTGVKGNEWWVQANVAANQPIANVVVRVDCAPSWFPLTLQSWGGWAASLHVPPGSKVDFMARSTAGGADVSGGYVWPQATATSGCALGAWPQVGSKAVYDLSSGVCGGGNCENAQARLTLTYSDHSWHGVCVGRDTFNGVDGTTTTTDWTSRLYMQPLFQKADTQVGAQHQVRQLYAYYGGHSCQLDAGKAYTVQRQEDYLSALHKPSGEPIMLRSWLATRDAPEDNFLDAHWDVRLGMVFEERSSGRMSGQGSSYAVLVDTDAPVR
jgi:hypothetical protein